jgi:hypothetical protein
MWMESSRRRSIGVFAFALAFVINPGYFAGCAGDTGDEFEFGEAEMLELVDGLNDQEPFVFSAADAAYRLELILEQEPGEDEGAVAVGSPLAQRARACGSRTFMNGASACVSSSGVALLATLRLYRTDEDADELVLEQELSGSLTAWGKALGASQIVLTKGFTRVQLDSSGDDDFELVRFATTLTDVTQINFAAR